MTPSQYHLAAELVEMIHEDFQGFHPGYRGVHAQGRFTQLYSRPHRRQRS